MNHDLEKELKGALRRHEPAPDFAARVMARLAESASAKRVEARSERLTLWRRWAGFFELPQLKWALAGALACLLLSVGAVRYRQHQYELAELAAREQAAEEVAEEAEGQRAKEQVMLALQIASAKLNVAQRKVRESSERNTELR